MDTQTRHALKQDKFAQATASGVNWLGEHRSNLVRWGIAAGVVVLLVVGVAIFRYVESNGADLALGAALDTYNAPLAQPGAPAESGSYSSASARAQAAHDEFQAVVQKYGWMPQGAKARYFAGVTDLDLGQTASAEKDLKAVAGSWNRNLANLAKLALAGLYHQSDRDAQAITLYNEIAAKPSETVPAAMAQLDLANLYAAQGKLEQARSLWAKVKDADKEGAAGSIAAQKLAAK